MIRKRLPNLRDESGIALAMSVALMSIMIVVSVTLLTLVAADNTKSRASATSDSAYQAAEAGFNAYISNLSEDPSFYVDYLAKGEATRTVGATTYKSNPNSNTTWTLSPTTTWTYSTSLTASSASQPWRPLGNGYEYLIKVYPISSMEVRIVSIGRPVNSTDLRTYRAIETLARSLSVSDFQMLSASDVSYGSTATTKGLVYVGRDNSTSCTNGCTHTLTHAGTAYSHLMSEGTIASSPLPTMISPASKFTPTTNPSIRTWIRTPIKFTDLTGSPLLAAFPTKAQTGMSASPQNGIYFNPPTSPAISAPDAWWFTFNSDGTVSVQKCMKATTTSGSPPVTTYYPIENKLPTCTPYPAAAPANKYTLSTTGGEDIYVTQDAIVSGTVNGKVTIYAGGTNNDIIIADNISYQTPGSNVLGLIANRHVIVACWEPQTNLSWRAATIALNGVWADDRDGTFSPTCGLAVKTSMTFTGSTAAYGKGTSTGSMSYFGTRTYNYDTTLRYLIPPDYPRIGSQYTIEVQREVSPNS